MAVLVAVLSAYGRLSSDNEVTALRSSGVGPWQMLLPAILFGLISAVGLAYFNNNVLPDLNYRSRQLQTDIKRLKPAMIWNPVYSFRIFPAMCSTLKKWITRLLKFTTSWSMKMTTRVSAER